MSESARRETPPGLWRRVSGNPEGQSDKSECTSPQQPPASAAADWAPVADPQLVSRRPRPFSSAHQPRLAQWSKGRILASDTRPMTTCCAIPVSFLLALANAQQTQAEPWISQRNDPAPAVRAAARKALLALGADAVAPVGEAHPAGTRSRIGVPGCVGRTRVEIWHRRADPGRIRVLLSSSSEEGLCGPDHVETDDFQCASAGCPILVRVSADEIRSVVEKMAKPHLKRGWRSGTQATGAGTASAAFLRRLGGRPLPGIPVHSAPRKPKQRWIPSLVRRTRRRDRARWSP
jgi:hypothetical protein